MSHAFTSVPIAPVPGKAGDQRSAACGESEATATACQSRQDVRHRSDGRRDRARSADAPLPRQLAGAFTSISKAAPPISDAARVAWAGIDSMDHNGTFATLMDMGMHQSAAYPSALHVRFCGARWRAGPVLLRGPGNPLVRQCSAPVADTGFAPPDGCPDRRVIKAALWIDILHAFKDVMAAVATPAATTHRQALWRTDRHAGLPMRQSKLRHESRDHVP